MQTDDNAWDDDVEIDVEALLQALLAVAGDKEKRAEVIRKISEKTGQTPEKVELVIAATINYLTGATRSN